MKKILLLTITLITFIFLFDSHAWARDGCWGGRFPHGNYCEGPGCGWYGERHPVTTRSEAEKILKQYFSPVDDVVISKIRERQWFFEAEIRDKKNKLVDVVIIDKRTGRIRSIY
jgi:hypothetical protein